MGFSRRVIHMYLLLYSYIDPGPAISRFCTQEGAAVPRRHLVEIDTRPSPSGDFLESIMILRCLIFIPRLLIVAMLAECLPVALVPEQFRISSVRFDVVHDCCLGISSFLQTMFAERM